MSVNPRLVLLTLTSVALGALAGAVALADEAAPTVTTPFRVLQLTVEVKGKAGTSVPFVVQVQGKGQACVLETTPVDLAQSEEGGVHPLAGAPRTGALVEVDAGSRRVNVQPGQVSDVRGRVHLARNGPARRIYALRVSELLPPPAAEGAGTTARGSLQIRISYVVRLEVRVENAQVATATPLQLVRAELVDQEGRAMVRAFVTNPGEDAVDLEARCQLRRDGRRVGPSFPLVLPVNARKSGPARVASRLLAGAQVRLEELVPAPLVAGRHTLAITFVTAAAQASKDTEVEVAPDAFPAQALALGRPIGALLVSPAQVELSLLRGAPRFVPLVLENTGDQPLDVRVELESGDMTWLALRIDTIQIPARSVRRLPLAVRASSTIDGPCFGGLKVVVTPISGSPVEGRLPVALVAGKPGPAKLELVGQPELTPDALVVTVKNVGELHAPLMASLAITESGRRVAELGAGHGAWLLPGRSERLLFPLPAVGAGRRQLLVTIRCGEGSIPVALTLDWKQ